MKIEKVTYQKTYSIGPYLTDKIGLEASVDEGESAADVLDNLRAAADEWHKSEHPHLYQDDYGISNPPTGSISYTKESIVSPVVQIEFRNGQQDTLDGIKSATTLEELSTFKKLSGNNKELYEAYNQRLKELTK